MLCEIGVVFAVVVGLGTVGAVGTVRRSHDDVVFLWRGDGDGCCRAWMWKNGVARTESENDELELRRKRRKAL
jgi:hypothetical protein